MICNPLSTWKDVIGLVPSDHWLPRDLFVTCEIHPLFCDSWFISDSWCEVADLLSQLRESNARKIFVTHTIPPITPQPLVILQDLSKALGAIRAVRWEEGEYLWTLLHPGHLQDKRGQYFTSRGPRIKSTWTKCRVYIQSGAEKQHPKSLGYSHCFHIALSQVLHHRGDLSNAQIYEGI